MQLKNMTAAMTALVVAHVLLASGSSAAASVGESQDAREITAIENEMAGETDVDKVMSHYSEDAILIDITSPGWYEGRKQIYAALQPQLAALQELKFQMDEISVASDGKFACAAMQVHFDATKKDHSQLKMSIRQVDAFEKIDGHWLIIQQHFSVPVDQKSSTPIFDSEATARGPLPWSEPGPKVPLAQAKTEIMNWLRASETPKSIDEMAGYYGNDFMIFDWWSPREVRGHQELHDYYGPQFIGVRNMQIKIPVVRIDTDGAFGVEVSQQHLKMNMKDGSSHLVSFRQSDCLRRVGNRWYSFFEMGSFPVDAKTGKAIMVIPEEN